MNVATPTESSVINRNQDGVYMVGATRVPIDTVVAAFLDGEVAEEIQIQFPALSLSEVYTAIGWYLENHDMVDAYLIRRSKEAARIRKACESLHNPALLRRRLMARMSRKTALHKSPQR